MMAVRADPHRAPAGQVVDPIAFDRVIQPRAARWSKASTDRFLDHLAVTGDVADAAQRVGIAPAQAYHRLRTNAGFAEGWSAAIRAGYQTIELRMIGQILAGADAMRGAPRIDWEQALRLLKQRDSHGDRQPRRSAEKPQVATRDETDVLILQRLQRIAERTQREAQR